MHIILDISYQDLYSSLDEYTSSTAIDEFTTPKGHKTRADKLVYFTSLSKVLTFQLQRVGYDAQKNAAVKKHSKFEFPKELFMDRYLDTNIDATTKKRKEIQLVKEEQSKLQQELNYYTNYNNSNFSIDALLNEAIDYINQKDLRIPISVIQKQREKVLLEIEQKKQKISELQIRIDSMYNDMKSLLYRLHAVLVHDGEAGSGHYWAYLYHPTKKSWFKFNDITVTEVDEETVWQDSFGGHLTASAYCIIYLHHSISEQSGLLDLTSVDKVEYSSIPLQLQASIAEDNSVFQSEKNSWEDKKDGSKQNGVNQSSSQRNFSSSQSSNSDHQVPASINMQARNESLNVASLRDGESQSNSSISSENANNNNSNNNGENNSEESQKFARLYQQKNEEILQSHEQNQNHPPQLQSFANFLLSTNHKEVMQFEITNLVYQELFGENLAKKVKPPPQLVNSLPNIPFGIPNSYHVLVQMYETCLENLEFLVIAFNSHLFDEYVFFFFKSFIT